MDACDCTEIRDFGRPLTEEVAMVVVVVGRYKMLEKEHGNCKFSESTPKKIGKYVGKHFEKLGASRPLFGARSMSAPAAARFAW